LKDQLFPQLRDLPAFRALIRGVEATYYQTLDLPTPILDVGCGDGHFASLVFNQKIDVGIDPWRAPILEAAGRKSYHMLVQADGSRVPFSPGMFSSAFSNSVLEHILDIEAVLGETARVLKPGAPFYFCVPNERYLSELSISRWLGNGYTRWFKQISRVIHADGPQIWETRLEQAGFRLERWWHYFSPSAMRVLEWGHYFGFPSLIAKFIFGKWIIAPTKWNLRVTEKFVRRFSSNLPVENGTFTFYCARRR
jgi:SAM-dependent methyltransferase